MLSIIILIPLLIVLAVVVYNTSRRVGTTSRLIVFTRYPTSGRCKTSVGADEATKIHVQMTESICTTLRQFVWQESLKGKHVRAEVYYDMEEELAVSNRGDELMRNWLGYDFTYHKQVKGNLTDRLLAVFNDAPPGKTIIMASDTPGITIDILNVALEKLDTHDVVIGPALDGGYYLIGMNRLTKELFTGMNGNPIPWSTDKVFQTSINICHALGISFFVDLPKLTDIDQPEDIVHWEEEKLRIQERNAHKEKISVIVPVLNEAAGLRNTLAHLSHALNIEIIIVDGGSTDSTLQIANEFKAASIHPVQIIKEQKGRARQQNSGVSHSSGDILLFVHGDTLLSAGYFAFLASTNVTCSYDEMIRFTLHNSGCVGGAFMFRIEDNEKQLSLYGKSTLELFTNWRARYLQLPYGDQSLFVRKDTFQRLGGFPNFMLMEDFEFVRRLSKQGRMSIIPVPAITSGRRWKKLGLLKTTLLNQIIISAYMIGVSPSKLVNWYYGYIASV